MNMWKRIAALGIALLLLPTVPACSGNSQHPGRDLKKFKQQVEDLNKQQEEALKEINNSKPEKQEPNEK